MQTQLPNQPKEMPFQLTKEAMAARTGVTRLLANTDLHSLIGVGGVQKKTYAESAQSFEPNEGVRDFYELLNKLRQHLNAENLEVVPGSISFERIANEGDLHVIKVTTQLQSLDFPINIIVKLHLTQEMGATVYESIELEEESYQKLVEFLRS